MGSYEQVVHATTYFSDVEFIEWASKYELIPDIHQIRICNRCAKLMFIHFHANLPDGAVWRCSDYSYSNTLSIRIDSWTKDSKLPLKTLARLVGCWCAGRTVQTASVDCSISKFTVTKYYQEFRQVAEALYRKDISSNPLGNTGGIIQINESHFFKAKYNKGKALHYDQTWFFGAIDDATNRIAIEKCESRKEEDLIQIIVSVCRPNSTIWSDSWKSYNNLNSYGYIHMNVNHKENFKDPITFVHTNKIEGNWNALKMFLRNNNVKSREWVESYVHEWCFRRNIGNTFEKCWNAILK